MNKKCNELDVSMYFLDAKDSYTKDLTTKPYMEAIPYIPLVPDDNATTKNRQDDTLKKKRDKEDIRPVCWYDGRCYETRHDHWSRFKHLRQDKPVPNTFHSVDLKFMALAFDSQ